MGNMGNMGYNGNRGNTLITKPLRIQCFVKKRSPNFYRAYHKKSFLTSINISNIEHRISNIEIHKACKLYYLSFPKLHAFIPIYPIPLIPLFTKIET